jgi:hypothetical protein
MICEKIAWFLYLQQQEPSCTNRRMNKLILLPLLVAFAAINLPAYAQSNDNSATSGSGDKYSLADRLGDPQLKNVDPKNKNTGGGPGNSGPGDKNPPGNDPGGKPPGNPAHGPSDKK